MNSPSTVVPSTAQAVELMIRIRCLQFRYPRSDFLLRIDQLDIERWAKVAIIGPSGCGKTTLLKLLAGIMSSPEGELQVAGIAVNRLGERARRHFRATQLGFVFQDFELLDYLDVMDNIVHPYRINGRLRLNKQVRSDAIRLASEMGIADKLKRMADQLSQGEKQRAAICRALLPGPKLVLADEPTGNLDPNNKSRIMDLLFQTVTQHAATLVAATHDHELLPRFDRVIDFQDFHRFLGHRPLKR
ncbi:MAG: ABC transporter ATP-binding protein [Gammaproteobacteria bacterium]